MDNVASDSESHTKVTWPDVTRKGKEAIKRIQSALANQNSEELFRKELMEAMATVFSEVYTLVKTNVKGFEDFLDQFPALHDLKHPIWAHMFQEPSFNAAEFPNMSFKKQLTDMEVKLKAISSNMPTTAQFIQVKS